jgi:hypothetical protein
MVNPRPHPTNPNAEIHDVIDEDGRWEAIHQLGIGNGDSSPIEFRHLDTGRILHGRVSGLASADNSEVLAALYEAKRIAASDEDI